MKYKNWRGSAGYTAQHYVYREMARTEFFQALDLMDNLSKNNLAF